MDGGRVRRFLDAELGEGVVGDEEVDLVVVGRIGGRGEDEQPEAKERNSVHLPGFRRKKMLIEKEGKPKEEVQDGWS